jgi:hypothetical protein
VITPAGPRSAGRTSDRRHRAARGPRHTGRRQVVGDGHRGRWICGRPGDLRPAAGVLPSSEDRTGSTRSERTARWRRVERAGAVRLPRWRRRQLRNPLRPAAMLPDAVCAALSTARRSRHPAAPCPNSRERAFNAQQPAEAAVEGNPVTGAGGDRRGWDARATSSRPARHRPVGPTGVVVSPRSRRGAATRPTWDPQLERPHCAARAVTHSPGPAGVRSGGAVVASHLQLSGRIVGIRRRRRAHVRLERVAGVGLPTGPRMASRSTSVPDPAPPRTVGQDPGSEAGGGRSGDHSCVPGRSSSVVTSNGRAAVEVRPR